MSRSRGLAVYKIVARYFQKPALAYLRPQWLARKLFDLNAAVTFRKPRGLRVSRQASGSWISVAGQEDRGVLFFVHGGAFVIGSVRAYHALAGRLAEATGLRAFAVDYRLAPEHPFPAAVEDVVAAYRGVLSEGHAPERITVCGDSAGGGLVLSLLHMIGQEGLPMPGAAVALSPIVDLELRSPSMEENLKKDPLIAPRWGLRGIQDYLAGQDPSNPRASPINGTFAGCPPILFQVGEDEVLRDESVRMAEVMRAQGVDVTLEVWPDVPHVWHLMAGWFAEADAGIEAVGKFVREKTGG